MSTRKMIGANILRIKKRSNHNRANLSQESKKEIADACARVMRKRGIHVPDGFAYYGTNTEGVK